MTRWRLRSPDQHYGIMMVAVRGNASIDAFSVFMIRLVAGRQRRRNGFFRPVLKHGPRSLSCVRVQEIKPRARNESEKLRSLTAALTTDHELRREV